MSERRGSQNGIRKMFDQVASRYDLFNRAASLGMDVLWRKRAARCIPRNGPITVIDVCAGTCDLTREIVYRLPEGSMVIGLDFSPGMLRIGKAKLSGLAQPVALTMARAEAMPLADGCADVACSAFALRNLEPVMDEFLAEMRRVLKPGGLVVLLETGRPTRRAVLKAYLAYLRTVLPLEGRLLSGTASPFRYLSRTVAEFYEPERFCEILREAGFAEPAFKRLSLGIATIYTAANGTVARGSVARG